ncbi:MAG: serine hydrolase [Pseudomonadota bacterium]
MTSYRNSEPRPPIMQGTPPPADWRVPFIDWDRPPWNRWAFQNVRQIMPTAEVWRGTGPGRDLPEDLRDVGHVEVTGTDGQTRTIDAFLDETYTDGFIVLKGGQIIHESYFNGMTRRSLHLSQSVAKSVTAMSAGALIGDGVLDPGTLLTDYIPELAETAYAGATLQHVLDMTSGARFSEDYTDRYSDIGAMDVASAWKPAPDGTRREDFPDCVFDQMLTLKTLEAEHGSRFLYRSIETDVVAHCMERATGKRLPEIVSDALWSGVGADESACFTVDTSGYALACGGFNATLRDYARFGLLVLGGGAWNGRQVIPQAWIDDTFSGPHGLFNDAGRELFPNGAYRNQFWIEDNDRQTILARGVFGQMIFISRDLDCVAVKLSTWPDFRNTFYDDLTRRAIRAIAEAV